MPYEPDPHNAGLRCDLAVVEALNREDPEALATALEAGGGTPGSEALDYLLLTIERKCQWELVRRLGRGEASKGILALQVDDQWRVSGLPEQTRATLINGLRSNEFRIRAKRVKGRVGRPGDALWWAKPMDVGKQIEAFMEEGHDLRNAIYLWIDQRLGRPPATEKEQGTWFKFARREYQRLLDARALSDEVSREIDN